jgi:uncharacterized membrane protein YfcA
MSKMFKSPYLETILMLIVIAVSYIAMGMISTGVETPPGQISAGSITLFLLGFFLLSFVIALVAVVAGIGGGVLFTPIMLAFTPVDSLIVRATGLVVAMFSGLISTGIFMRQGLANMRICVFSATAYGVGAFIGAKGAIYVAKMLGEFGEGLVRIALGIILFLLAGYFIFGGKKIEWPDVPRTDGFTRWLGFSQPYYEESLGKVIDYKLHRSWLLLIVIVIVGMLSGFFGLGAGWAIVPAQNIVMGVPLKVAAANSGVLLGMGDCVAVWPYLLMGAMIPLFAAPWLVGQVIGGIVGALVLIRIKAGFVRIILIGIMFFTCYGLIGRGLNTMGVIGEIPTPVTLAVIAVIAVAVIRGVVKAIKAG